MEIKWVITYKVLKAVPGSQQVVLNKQQTLLLDASLTTNHSEIYKMTEQVTNALQLPFSSKKYLNSNSPTVIPHKHTHILKC